MFINAFETISVLISRPWPASSGAYGCGSSPQSWSCTDVNSPRLDIFCLFCIFLEFLELELPIRLLLIHNWRILPVPCLPAPFWFFPEPPWAAAPNRWAEDWRCTNPVSPSIEPKGFGGGRQCWEGRGWGRSSVLLPADFGSSKT